MNNLNIIVAVDEKSGFALKKQLPWKNSNDLKHFASTTKDGIIIMGRNTYNEIAENVVKRTGTEDAELLKGRNCYIITSKPESILCKNSYPVSSLREALEKSSKEFPGKEIFIIGGERIFWQGLQIVNSVHLTLIPGDYKCDQFFPVDYLNKHFYISSGKKEGDLLMVKYNKRS